MYTALPFIIINISSRLFCCSAGNTNFTFHAVDSETNQIIDYDEFLRRIEGRDDEIVNALEDCRVIAIIVSNEPHLYLFNVTLLLH